MGADIAVRGRTAMIRAVERLRGASVACTDVPAAAALVLAGLSAAGEPRCTASIIWIAATMPWRRSSRRVAIDPLCLGLKPK